MLTIQNRIEQYHYAYGLWPDSYQAPHPYSIHEYFDKKTLELFERAFAKGQERPSAYEWQEHLWKMLHSLKQCKNPNHAYFTAKGCGLCMVEDKFKGTLSDIKKQKESPQTIRGMELEELKTENVRRDKEEKLARDKKLTYISLSAAILFMVFLPFYINCLNPGRQRLRPPESAFRESPSWR